MGKSEETKKLNITEFEFLENPFLDVVNGLQEMNAGFDDLIKISRNVVKEISKISKEMKSFGKEMQKAGKKSLDLVSGVSKIGESFFASHEAERKFVNSLETFFKSGGGIELAINGALMLGEALIDHITKPAREAKKQITILGQGIADSLQEMYATSPDDRSIYENAFTALNYQQGIIESQIQEVQQNINEILITEMGERAILLSTDIEQLGEYYEKLQELNKRKLEIETQKIDGSVSLFTEEMQGVTEFSLAKSKGNTGLSSIRSMIAQQQEDLKAQKVEATLNVDLLVDAKIKESNLSTTDPRHADEVEAIRQEYQAEYNVIDSWYEGEMSKTNASMGRAAAETSSTYARIIGDQTEFMDKLNANLAEQTALENEMMAAEFVGEPFEVMINKQAQLENKSKEFYNSLNPDEITQMYDFLGSVMYADMTGGYIDTNTRALADQMLGTLSNLPASLSEELGEKSGEVEDVLRANNEELYLEWQNNGSDLLSKWGEITTPAEVGELPKVLQEQLTGLKDEQRADLEEIYTYIETYANGGELDAQRSLELNNLMAGWSTKYGTEAEGVMGNIVEVMVGGLQERSPGLTDKMKESGDVWMKSLADSVGVQSPSVITTEMFENVVQGGIDGLGNKQSKLLEKTEELALAVISKMQTTFTNNKASNEVAVGTENVALQEAGKMQQSFDATTLQASGSKIIQTLIDGMQAKLESLKLKVTELQTAITTPWDSFSLYEIGVNTAQGLIDGMQSKMEELRTLAAEMASIVHTAYAKEDNQHSPSKVMRQHGVYSGMGVELGLRDSLPGIQNASQQMAAAVSGNYATRTPESSTPMATRTSTVINNTNQPQFNLTIGGGATADDRNTERKVRQWVIESMERVMESEKRRGAALVQA